MSLDSMGQAAQTSEPDQTGAVPPAGSLRDYIKLTKLMLNLLVVITTLAGFAIASGTELNWVLMFWTALGTGLAALGSSGFNQLIERERDARMERTKERPLPGGRLAVTQVFIVSLVLAVAGDLLLLLLVNWLTALLALIVQLVYLVLYTPLKSRTTLATIVGGICGALPPMMGFSAVTGTLPPAAWMLGAILFAWQIPHFLALAWMYRQDYARGGMQVLPNVDREGRVNANMLLVWSLVLVPLTLLAVLTGIGRWAYAIGALMLGILLCWLAMRAYHERNRLNARRLFLGTVTYLPLLLLLMVADTRAGLPVGPAIPGVPHAAKPAPTELNDFDLSRALIPTEQIDVALDRDSIPALTEPDFIKGQDAGEHSHGGHGGGKFIVGGDRIIGVSINGDSRAYPLRFLNWHELVNDEVGGVPILVTYCPLCDSALVFERTIAGEVREFGVSGLLYNSNVLMFDRREDGSESLWSQLGRQAISGPAAEVGLELTQLPAEFVRWEGWLARHPDTLVMKGRDDIAKRYKRNPYGHYFHTGSPRFPVTPEWTGDDPAPLTPIVAIRQPGGWLLFRYDSELLQPLSWEDPELGLSFVYEPPLGAAMTPPVLRVTSLGAEQVDVVYTFWFAWYALYPESQVPVWPGPLKPAAS